MSTASSSSTAEHATPRAAAARALALALAGAGISGRLRRGEVLAPYTTFSIGGRADLFFEARSAAELTAAVTAARHLGIPFFLLGLGANILVGDAGFRGLVIRNRAARLELRAGHCLRAESGAVVFPDLIEVAIGHGLSGLEHYAGIPSTVGGALWQNLHFLAPAPARERTMFIAEVTAGAEILTVSGERREVEPAYFEFGYDSSVLHHRPDIVLAANFQLAPADPARLRRIVSENLAWRAERHPPLDSEPSVGSIFKKIAGIGAGRLIEECGLKGARRGGVVVTHRHANIMINQGGATAADVRALIAHVQEVVERRTGYRLEPEILFVGDF
ncbi:MAG TPA: UDP-N-acetylmuramate dehydrogenase [Thermoanaerobaculia bacterium]|nr:UDP-N-acetylmuramate dehydrogenase [Thermoanaerobaculia bacterium]